jgi:hypothetical protein
MGRAFRREDALADNAERDKAEPLRLNLELDLHGHHVEQEVSVTGSRG